MFYLLLPRNIRMAKTRAMIEGTEREDVAFRAGHRRASRSNPSDGLQLDRRSGDSKMSRSIMYEAFFMLWKLRLQSLFKRL